MENGLERSNFTNTSLRDNLVAAAKILQFERRFESELGKELSDAESRLAQKTAEYNNLQAKARQSARNASVNGQRVVSLILMGLSLLLPLLLMVPVPGSEPLAPAEMVTGIVFIFVPMFIIGLVLLLKCKSKLQHYQSVAMVDRQLADELGRQIPPIQRKVESIRSALVSKKSEIEGIKNAALATVPYLYRNIEAITNMAILVDCGRADTLKEAMNLYEEERRFNRLLSVNAAMSSKLFDIEGALINLKRSNDMVASDIKQLLKIQTADFIWDD